MGPSYSDVVLRDLIGNSLPCGVGEIFGAGPDDLGLLFPEEAAALSLNAVEKRRREYVGGRVCARLALKELCVAAGPILQGDSHEPLWPDGFVGSLTHCRGYVAALVTSTRWAVSVGIDAEPNEPLPINTLCVVATAEELELVHRQRLTSPDSSAHFDRVLFCVKEAVYKYWFQYCGHPLHFQDAVVRMTSNTVTARIETPTGPFDVYGAWKVSAGLVIATVWEHVAALP